MARATHNKVLEKIVSSFNLLMASGGVLIERREGGIEYAMAEYESHRHLCEVLRSRDPDKAQQAVEEHIGHTLDILENAGPVEAHASGDPPTGGGPGGHHRHDENRGA